MRAERPAVVHTHTLKLHFREASSQPDRQFYVGIIDDPGKGDSATMNTCAWREDIVITPQPYHLWVF